MDVKCWTGGQLIIISLVLGLDSVHINGLNCWAGAEWVHLLSTQFPYRAPRYHNFLFQNNWIIIFSFYLALSIACDRPLYLPIHRHVRCHIFHSLLPSLSFSFVDAVQWRPRRRCTTWECRCEINRMKIAVECPWHGRYAVKWIIKLLYLHSLRTIFVCAYARSRLRSIDHKAHA